MLFIYFDLNAIKIREITIWSAHSEGVLQRSPCTTTPIAKADKFNYLNPIAAILNMAKVCAHINKTGRVMESQHDLAR